MKVMEKIQFIKMHGLGNDFVIIDRRREGEMPPRAVMARMTNRKLGIGCDQVIPILPPQDPKADVFMRIINSPDATEAQACGNATRCVAEMIMKEKNSSSCVIQTVAGLLYCTQQDDGRIKVDMGIPRLKWNEIPVREECDTLFMPLPLDEEEGEMPVGVNIGNPHAVFFVRDVEHFPVKEIGSRLEHAPLFPEKANIEFAKVINRQHIRMRVWERDSGETDACGSAACATMVAAFRRGYVDRKCVVELNGGILEFEWRESDNHICMTGPVSYVFKGEMEQ
jgi:diaminopimelate epimerase